MVRVIDRNLDRGEDVRDPLDLVDDDRWTVAGQKAVGMLDRGVGNVARRVGPRGLLNGNQPEPIVDRNRDHWVAAFRRKPLGQSLDLLDPRLRGAGGRYGGGRRPRRTRLTRPASLSIGLTPALAAGYNQIHVDEIRQPVPGEKRSRTPDICNGGEPLVVGQIDAQLSAAVSGNVTGVSYPCAAGVDKWWAPQTVSSGHRLPFTENCWGDSWLKSTGAEVIPGWDPVNRDIATTSGSGYSRASPAEGLSDLT